MNRRRRAELDRLELEGRTSRQPRRPGGHRHRLDPVAALRKRLRLSQEEFAERLGVRQGSISHWESGKPLSAQHALLLWRGYGRRLRLAGVKLEHLLLPRGETPP